MSVRVQRQKLQMLANDFYRGTAIQLSVLDADRQPIAAAGLGEHHFCNVVHGIDNEAACKSSDKYILDKCTLSHKPELHICHAGLIDIAVPIIYGEKICGYLIMGRMRRNIAFSELSQRYPEKYREELREKYDSLPVYSEERAMSILSLASMLAAYIITEEIMVKDTENTVGLITKYIRENLHRSISVGDICHQIGISKNTLNRCLQGAYGMSTGEYLIKERIELAKRLLLHTDEPVWEICEQTGFSDSSYFIRAFKKHTGMTPAKFRKVSGEMDAPCLTEGTNLQKRKV